MPQQTIAMQLAREFIAERHGKSAQRWRVYNDRLANGDRSIKVPAWGLRDYEQFEQWLRRRGIVSSIVTFAKAGPAWNGGGRTQYRIHVDENC